MRRRTFLLSALAGATVPFVDPELSFAATGATKKNIKRGGKMTVTYKNDPGTLDPAIAYNWENWPMLRALFSRPLGYEPGTTKLTTDAAKSWHVSKDGKVYSIIMRPDVKFYDGSKVTAHDVKYSIERVINPKTASPGQSFYDSLEGYEEASKGKAEHVSGIKVIDDNHLEFRLSAPDATFPQVLALNFSSIVKKEAVEKYGKDFAHHPVGSGAFYVERYNPGNMILWKRNKHYYVPNVPYLDEIEFKLGVDQLTAFFQLIRGENDLLGDGIPGSQLAMVESKPKYKKLMVVGHPLETSYITMNTQLKPFNDRKVRRAVNMAIDKKHVVRVINGRGKPADQILPPGMPGYDPSYKGYEYNPNKARQLLKEAGYKDGFKTELYAMNTAPEPKIAQALQADLKKVGIDVELRLLSQAQVVSIAGTPKKAPMVWSGGLAWEDDFPDPSDFYGPILGCGSAIKGGWNWAFYCNKKTDEMAHRANRMYEPDQRSDRLKLWQKIFSDVMDDAPWVPVFNKIKYVMHSDKVAGNPSKVFVDPGIFPFNYAYMYSTSEQD